MINRQWLPQKFPVGSLPSFLYHEGADLELENIDGRTVLDLVSQQGAPQSIRRVLEDHMRLRGRSALKSSAARHSDISDARRRRYDARGPEPWTCKWPYQ